ncbi:ubiquitin carboxyl-terminal hydrolase, family 1 [Pseudovirgaria hyperparasitica]|uniref:Ubiquitin carboxyl-terminal hydrolase n=1 Tax=Pseudovirgaria hyperparasitica TaxID=470096 RepID=A0A6A6WD35_9PEZI|nr:ubiquitin carboxyl-terminal hydrolase, family 1 [Pseudovirgaria hyperparasitica]KAF2760485.1 ubiquitin carboxyl-terminal hydrolase, family 1 [Pseudovirgaria hyperparasitica]
MYEKHFIPLESDLQVSNELLRDLGVRTSLRFEDVMTLDNPLLLPTSALALILIFPTSETYECRKSREEASSKEDDISDTGLIWFRQSINNACGLYAILHAMYNSGAKHLMLPESLLANLLGNPLQLTQQQRCKALEQSKELEDVYTKAALQGSSTPPINPQEEVDYHFITFVKDSDGHVFELDGDRKCPLNKNIVTSPNEDMLSEQVRTMIRNFIDQEEGRSDGFSLMALVEQPEGG